MWIQTQNRQRIINSDQIIDIFISKTGTKIYANTTVGHHEPGDTSQFILGEYKDRDTCLKVLESISVVIGSRVSMITMPLDGEIDTWSKDIADIAMAYIVNDFRIK